MYKQMFAKTNNCVYICIKDINTMIVHYAYMTGDELHTIYKLSNLTQEEFAAMIGKESRQQLITQFNRKNQKVDDDVEKKVKATPELAQHRMMIVSKQNEVDRQTNEGGEVVRFLTDTIQVLKDVLVKGEKQTAVMQKAVDSLVDSNKHIIEEAQTYRKILMDGYEAGPLEARCITWYQRVSFLLGKWLGNGTNCRISIFIPKSTHERIDQRSIGGHNRCSDHCRPSALFSLRPEEKPGA